MQRVRLIIAIVVLAAIAIALGLYFQPPVKAPASAPGQTETAGDVADIPADEPATPESAAEEAPSTGEAPAEVPEEEVTETSQPAVAEAMAEEEVVPRPVKIYGVVLDAKSDEPVAGAEMNITPDIEGLEPVLTDEAGGYTLETIIPARAEVSRLTCVASGYTRTRETLVLPPADEAAPDAPVDLRLDLYLWEGAAIGGTVVDARTLEPLPGVRLTATLEGGNFMERMTSMGRDGISTTTDEEGLYRLENLEITSYMVVADGASIGYIMDASAMKTVAIPEGEPEATADFQLTLGGTVRGVVSTPDKSPVEELRVMVMPGGGLSDMTSGMFSGGASPMMGMMPVMAEIGENGHYSANGLAYDRKYRVTAQAEDYAGARSESFTVSKASSEAVVNLTLQRGSTVSGKAVYEDGSPAAERKLMLFPDLGEIMGGNLPTNEDQLNQQAGEDGSFTFKTVPAGKYMLMAEPMADSGFDLVFGGGEYRVPVEVDGENDVKGLKLVLQRPTAGGDDAQPAADGKIEGTVIAWDGNPAADVTVTARGEAAGFDPTAMMAQPVSARTDEDGAFTLQNLDKQRYDLQVKSPLGNIKEPGVTVDSKVTLRLEAPTRLRGVVYDIERNVVQGCSVTLKPAVEEDFNIMALMGMGGGGDEARETDEFGVFEFDNVVAGEYTLAAKSRTSGTGATELFTVVPGNDMENFEIILTPGVAFSGRVVDSGNNPVEGATVALQPAAEGMAAAMSQFLPAGMRGQAASAQTGADGTYEMLRVPPGTYTVNASHGNFSPTNIKDVVVEAGKDVRDFEIVLRQGGCLEGVTVLKGEVRSGIMVQAMGEGGMFMATSDEDGNFEICNLPEGTYLVQAVDAGSIMGGDLSNMQFKQVSAEVFDGQTTTVSFEPPENTATIAGAISGDLGLMTQVNLRRPGGLAPEEMDPLDTQAAMAQVAYQAGTAMADGQGNFSIEGVEPGTYFLEVFVVNINPADVQSMMEMDRTPQIRMEIEVEEGKDQFFELSLPVAAP